MSLKKNLVLVLFFGLGLLLNGCASPFKKAMLAGSLSELKTAYEEADSDDRKEYLKEKNIDGTTALIYAISKNNMGITEYLLDIGANVNTTVSSKRYYSTPLIAAIRNGSNEISLLLIEKGADINNPGTGQYTPFALAISKQMHLVVSAMENSGKLSKASYSSALYRIVVSKETLAYKKEKIAEYIKSGADVNAVDNASERTPLTATTSVELMEYLIENGADVNKENAKYVTPLMAASNNLEVVKLLVSKGADINAVDREGNLALFYAFATKTLSVFDYYLSKGININYKNKSGKTVLIYTVEWNYDMDILKHLIDKGADIRLQDKSGRAALNYAAKNNNTEIVKFLAVRGADFRNKYLLYDSVQEDEGDAGMLTYMIQCGAGSDNAAFASTTSSRENEALLRAAELHNFAAQKVLIRAGANPLATYGTSKRGLWHYAAEKYVSGQMDYLRRTIPREMDRPDKDGITPLMIAAKAGDLSAAQYLAESGADIEAKDKNGHDAIYYADNADKDEVKDYLRQELARQQEAAQHEHEHKKNLSRK